MQKKARLDNEKTDLEEAVKKFAAENPMCKYSRLQRAANLIGFYAVPHEISGFEIRLRKVHRKMT